MPSTRSIRRGTAASSVATVGSSLDLGRIHTPEAASSNGGPLTDIKFNSSSGTGTDIIKYPQGCKDINGHNMKRDELIRRLKALASYFQSIKQEENVYDAYIPLCLHLAQDEFLHHSSKDVRLLVACCIADILRIYAPEAPYKDQEQIKIIFTFLIEQLGGLKDPKHPAFKRYFYLLENLAYVKSFNMCFGLDDAQENEVFCQLFQLMFQIVNDDHSYKVKSIMLDVLCPLVSECETVSNELLNTILSNIVEPNKTSKKNPYNLAKELIIKCSEKLEPYIQNFFNQVLIGEHNENEALFISQKVYDLIYELNQICPTVLLAVIPQLEYKLKSVKEAERIGSVSLLARMFSEKESKLAVLYPQLWQAFLSRFNDVSIGIRIKCTQYSMHFLRNHTELRSDIVKTLKERQHDSDENVRFEVVKSIVATAKYDFPFVSANEDLLHYVKERTLDKKFKIRREALQGLARIYKAHLSETHVPSATRQAVTWMKDKILHGYYLTSIDDRILIEHLVNTCLVPYQLDPHERMQKLLYLFGTIDDNASKAFIEIQKNLVIMRRHVKEFLQCIKSFDETRTAEYESQLVCKIPALIKYLPDPVKGFEFIHRFSEDLKNDTTLLKTMNTIVSPDTDCKTCAESMNAVLKKLGSPIMTNLYYNTIKILIERISSVLIDKEAIGELLLIVHKIANNTEELEELGLSNPTAMDRSLRLISVLAFVFPSHFCNEVTLNILIGLLSCVTPEVIPTILSSLTFIGKGSSPIGQTHPRLMKTLVSQCQQLLATGYPRQGKASVRCLFANMKESARNRVFKQIIGSLRDNLNLESSNTNFRTAIVALGHIAYLMPEEFRNDMKQIISQKIVKELLVHPQRTEDDRHKTGIGSWCDEDNLPEVTRCMIVGMKAIARWLIGLKTDLTSATKTFRMLVAFVQTSGAFIKSNVPFSTAEESWLRLSAGCCMLKICEQKGVGDQFTAAQFCDLSVLMTDEVLEVRSRFSKKLHKGLSRGIPHKCLPLDFMGYYALGGYETDRKQRNLIKSYMMNDVSKRREYIKALLTMSTSNKASEQLPHIMPDYMLVFAVPVLTHHPRFSDYTNVPELTTIKDCLWFILEPLVVKNENYSFGFYKTLIERMKNHKSIIHPENEMVNNKMYAICDIALGLILQKSRSFEMKEYPSQPRIPPMYFKTHAIPNWTNTKSYLPYHMQYVAAKRAGKNAWKDSMEKGRESKTKKLKKETVIVDAYGNVSIDAQPNDYNETCLKIPGLKDQESDSEKEGSATKVNNMVQTSGNKVVHSKTIVDNKSAALSLQEYTDVQDQVVSRKQVKQNSRRNPRAEIGGTSHGEASKQRTSSDDSIIYSTHNLSQESSNDAGTHHSTHTPTLRATRSANKVITFLLPEDGGQAETVLEDGSVGMEIMIEEDGPLISAPALDENMNADENDDGIIEEVTLEEIPPAPHPVAKARRGRPRKRTASNDITENTSSSYIRTRSKHAQQIQEKL